MKIKSILFLIIIIILTFFIYKSNKDNKIYYVNIKDNDNNYSNIFKDIINKRLELYYEYHKEDIRITDLINSIEKNEELIVNYKAKPIENVLIKADLLTISIGNSYIYYKINYASTDEMYEYFDELLNDYEKLILILRKYCKERIVVFGYISPSSEYDDLFNYLNDKLEKLCKKKKIYFFIDEKSLKNNISKW